MPEPVCCQCESPGPLHNLYGYAFCDGCQTRLGLHSDKTILKNARQWAQTKSGSYEDEVTDRLLRLEKDVAKTKVKLFHILARLGELT